VCVGPTCQLRGIRLRSAFTRLDWSFRSSAHNNEQTTLGDVTDAAVAGRKIYHHHHYHHHFRSLTQLEKISLVKLAIVLVLVLVLVLGYIGLTQ